MSMTPGENSGEISEKRHPRLLFRLIKFVLFSKNTPLGAPPLGAHVIGFNTFSHGSSRKRRPHYAGVILGVIMRQKNTSNPSWNIWSTSIIPPDRIKYDVDILSLDVKFLAILISVFKAQNQQEKSPEAKK